MRVLLIDNFDSFTYNLYDYISELGFIVDVHRNDAFDLTKLEHYSHIVISPGPGLPSDAGCTMQLIQEALGKIPILGVCLGMQALGVHFGERLYNLNQVRHGIQMRCEVLEPSVLFNELPHFFEVGLYHSWALNITGKELKIVALSEEGVVMAIESEAHKCYGVQFHPESIMTPHGKKILKNFLKA